MVHFAALRSWGGRFVLTLLVLSVCASVTRADGPPKAKNVILLISDGAGFNAFRAASFYEHGELGHQPYDAFAVHVGCTTYALNPVDAEGKVTKPAKAVTVLPQGYDPQRMWAGPDYVAERPTDSAAAATVLYSGIKTTGGRMGMNWDGTQPRITIAQFAHAMGKATGTVSTVQASHATPGAMWSHEPSRDAYSAIFNEMVYQSGLDVIIGAGHPRYDDNAQPVATPDYQYVGGEATWADLTDGDGIRGFRFVDSLDDFQALAAGEAPAGSDVLPAKLVGIPRAHKTVQFGRDGKDPAPECPKNEGVPDLATMARAAINVLQQDPEGFVLMIEGGAVDWANHANRLGRMVEEQTDFNRAVAAVVEWVEKESSWDETLVIVTADHECGMLWSPDSFRDADDNGRFDSGKDEWLGFKAVESAGKGVLPRGWYGKGSHTNALVPLWANGPASELFAELVDGVDPRAGEIWGFSGKYVDNTDVFRVMHQAIARGWIAPADDAQPIPDAVPVTAGK